MIKLFLIFLFLAALNVFPQAERYTKGAENGYAWFAMDDSALHYSISKENYLSSILDRIKLTKEVYPEVSSLGCKNEINLLIKQGKSEEISLNHIVTEINNFYSQKDNMVIPIIFAYCYTIKKLAGTSSQDLELYKNEVLLFCYE